MINTKTIALLAVAALCLLRPMKGFAQTDDDALMMAKKNLCINPTYSYSSWDHYWEGTFKRNNLNLGTVSTQSVSLMGNYGITGKLNFLVGAPYVWTHASAGTLAGMHGVQDLSAWVKWLALSPKVGNGVVSVFLLGGTSLPLTNYLADYLPLSIGLHSKTFSGRLMVDYQLGKFFATASGTYTYRDDITVDRTAYYTTTLHQTNKVYMPNVESVNFRTGYRSNRWIIEALFSDMITLGGFDIRKNDMPFPSNKMESTMVGVHVKYVTPIKHLEVSAEGSYTVAGRNVGQSKSVDAGILYILDFSKSKTKQP